jgi:hypothetical protein
MPFQADGTLVESLIASRGLVDHSVGWRAKALGLTKGTDQFKVALASNYRVLHTFIEGVKYAYYWQEHSNCSSVTLKKSEKE